MYTTINQVEGLRGELEGLRSLVDELRAEVAELKAEKPQPETKPAKQPKADKPEV